MLTVSITNPARIGSPPDLPSARRHAVTRTSKRRCCVVRKGALGVSPSAPRSANASISKGHHVLVTGYRCSEANCSFTEEKKVGPAGANVPDRLAGRD